ncbi:MAG: OmpH family outer membrane protein [Mariniblastus sp.]|nr:OmpH family outer membrane protein [Mariniblastus sp.]
MNFKRSTFALVSSFSLLILSLAATASAQTNVALVDIGKIFKNHPQFSQQLDQLKTQADQFKASTQQLQQQFMSKAEDLNQFNKNSEEYRQMEAKLAQESAEMEVEQRSKMRNLLTAEARLHFDTYNEIQQYISQYCQERGIQLVIRYDSQPMNQNDPASIMQRVNGGVIFNRPGKDITEKIIERILQVRNAQNPSGTLNK